MVRVSPTIHVSPPLGAVRARAPRILKFAGDVWVTVASLLRVILTLTVVEIASGTVQAKLPPAAGVESVMVWTSAAKLSRENSSFTLPSVPLVVQVMFWLEPNTQTSPPTGAVRVSEPLMVKAAESAETVASVACFTRTLTVLAIASATVQEQLPPAGPLAGAVAVAWVAVERAFLEDLGLNVVVAPAAVE